MFDAYCPTCAKRHLVFAAQIRGISNTPDLFAVEYECWCGATSTWTTGRVGADLDETPHSGSPDLTLVS
jgi:hypothetical protein